MDNHHRGKQSFQFKQPPVIRAWASIAGKKEGEGPLGDCFDQIVTDSLLNEKTWEQAELKLQKDTFDLLLKKAGLQPGDIEAVASGDLLNQCISSSMSLNNCNIPHLGLYGACSTMSESLLIGSLLVGGGFTNNAVAMTSSHFASSERQFRFPLDYGGQRTPTAQWTVTGSGAVLLDSKGVGPRITACTIGTVVDNGIKDANNMGSAMAPAALSTIQAHLKDLNTSLSEFDHIITGDLGKTGTDALIQLGLASGLDLSEKLIDCGMLVFDREKQDVHAGGSGCGCSAITLCGYFLDQLNTGKLKKILFCATGALLSPTSVQQGLTIPGVCHAVSIEGVL